MTKFAVVKDVNVVSASNMINVVNVVSAVNVVNAVDVVYIVDVAYIDNVANVVDIPNIVNDVLMFNWISSADTESKHVTRFLPKILGYLPLAINAGRIIVCWLPWQLIE